MKIRVSKTRLFELLFERYKQQVIQVNLQGGSYYTGVFTKFTGSYVVLSEVTDWNKKYYKQLLIHIKSIKNIEIY